MAPSLLVSDLQQQQKVDRISAELLKLLENGEVVHALLKILIKYQPAQVTMYEIERCVYTLKHIDCLGEYLCCEICKDVCVFLPSNLPLYSTFLFAVMPAIVTRSVTIRPNTTLIGQGVIEKLFTLLSLPRLLPNIQVFCGSRQEFRDVYLSAADMIIFTGRNETRDEIKKCMKPNSFLINNGSGHNPIVMAADADIEICTRDVVYARFFNSGQDCAGPDVVFVHDELINEFLKRLKEKVSHLSVMDHEEDELFLQEQEQQKQPGKQPVLQEALKQSEDIVLAKIHRVDEVVRLESVFKAFRNHITFGGSVDMERKIVQPTIILDDILLAQSQGAGLNFTEVFGPILFLYVYHKDEDLQAYFRDPKYIQNKMYVSLYGTSNYIQSHNDEDLIKLKGSAKGGAGILLHNKIIHDLDVDNGTLPYGGYSKGASSILHVHENSQITSIALPVLIPKVMYQLFVKHTPISDLLRVDEKPTLQQQYEREEKALKQTIANELLAMVKSIFKSNVNFAFAFGSVTEKKYTLTENGIRTFVCSNEESARQRYQFVQGIIHFHDSHGFNFDRQFPAEVISCSELRRCTNHLYYQLHGENYNPWWDDQQPVNCSFLTDFKCHDEHTYDVTFQVTVLAEKVKFALITRDKNFLNDAVEAAKEITALIREEMLENLRDKVEHDEIPPVLQGRYPHLSAREILAKLEKQSCCEILRHVEWMPPELRTYKVVFD